MITRYQTIFLLPCLLCSSLTAMDTASSSGVVTVSLDAQAVAAWQERITRSIPLLMEQCKLMKEIEERGFDVLENEPQTPASLYSTLQPFAKLCQMLRSNAKMPSAEQAEESYKKLGCFDFLTKATTGLDVSMTDFIAVAITTFEDARCPKMLWDADLAFNSDLAGEITKRHLEDHLPINLVQYFSKRLAMMLEVAKEHPELPGGQEIAETSKQLVSTMREVQLSTAADQLSAAVNVYETSLEKAAN